MKKVVSLVLVSLISGCAFKHPEAKPKGMIDQQQSSLRAKDEVSYSATLIEGHNGEPPNRITGTTTLHHDTETNQLQSEFALVLPVVVPDTITIETRLMDIALPDVLRGELRVGDRLLREIPSAAFLIEGGQSGMPVSIKFALTEMKQYFAADAQTSVMLHLFSTADIRNANPFVSFEISTPPSKITATPYLPMEAFEKKMKVTIPESLHHAVLNDGRQVELVGVFELRNGEVAPVEISIPQQLAHKLEAAELQTQISVSECGHSISRENNSKRIESELWLIPLHATVDSDHLTLHIAPGGVAHIGAFSTVGAALTPGEDRVSPQVVPTRCMAHCQRGAEGDWSNISKWGWDCYNCGSAPSNEGEACYSCMRNHREWCRWQDWRDWKDHTTVAVGTKYSFILSPAPDSKSASSKFSAKFLNQSIPGRDCKLLHKNVSILR